METTIKTRTVHGEPMHIHIRLSDPCKNGHDDWAITADIWEKGRPQTDRNISRCGCYHDDILKAKKSLKPFVDLHLSDADGAPMYAIENGFYHLQGVQGVAAYGHTCSIGDFAEYMRVDLDEAIRVSVEIKDKESFAKWVDTLRPRWKRESENAKQLLQELIKQEAAV